MTQIIFQKGQEFSLSCQIWRKCLTQAKLRKWQTTRTTTTKAFYRPRGQKYQLCTQMWNRIIFLQVSGPDPMDNTKISHDLWTPCSPGDPKAVEKSWMDIPGDKLGEPAVDFNMMLRSLNSQKKTVNDEDLERLSKFASDFGQDGWKNLVFLVSL